MTTVHHQLERLEELVKAMTVELIDCGGTTPLQTCEVIAEEAPDLYNLFGEDWVLALCEHIQRSEVYMESARLQAMFLSFNETYFGGQLPEYEVRVVYDIAVWDREDPDPRNPSAGYIDLENRQIFVRLSEFSMESILLHEMAHASAGPSHDDDWLNEMKRLKGLGAPIEQWELE